MKRVASLSLLALLSISLASCHKKGSPETVDPLLSAYATEPSWNDPQKLIPLTYQQAQGKRLFYQYCVWCHADSTPSGPSNRSNVTPAPALMNDGGVLNSLTDEEMRNIITLGGSAVGKSAMMPPYGRTLRPEEIEAVIAFTRAIAEPAYKPHPQPGTGIRGGSSYGSGS